MPLRPTRSAERWANDAQRRITEALHDDYVRRTPKLIRGVFPLLQTLSTGAMDADIRWRARIESRRLRLSHLPGPHLRPSAGRGIATGHRGGRTQRGVVVSLNADNDLPRLDREQRRRLLEPIEAALARAPSSMPGWD